MAVVDDVVFVGLFVVMFGLAFGYVRLCGRIVGDVDRSADPDRGR